MSKTATPLDSNRWTLAEPKNASIGLPEIPGSRLRGTVDDVSVGSKENANRKEILEKV